MLSQLSLVDMVCIRPHFKSVDDFDWNAIVQECKNELSLEFLLAKTEMMDANSDLDEQDLLCGITKNGLRDVNDMVLESDFNEQQDATVSWR